MGKKHIRASEIVYDILVGMTNSDLMKKYSLSANGLQTVIMKLVKAGSLKKSDIEGRMPVGEPVQPSTRKCPRCGQPQLVELEKCSNCGAMLAEIPTDRADPLIEAEITGRLNIRKSAIERSVLEDIKGGFTDEELMATYRLSRQEILNLLSRFLWDGRLTHEDLEKRKSLAKTVYMPTYTCPACQKVHFEKLDRCLHCNAPMKPTPTPPRKSRKTS
jgi:Mor family transcriptional regulator